MNLGTAIALIVAWVALAVATWALVRTLPDGKDRP